MDRGAWWATVHGGHRVGHNWVTKLNNINSAEGETLCSVLISHRIHPLIFFKPQPRSHSSPVQQHNPSLIFPMITMPFTQMNTYSLIQLLLLYSLSSLYWIVFFLSFLNWPHLQLVGSEIQLGMEPMTPAWRGVEVWSLNHYYCCVLTLLQPYGL